MRGWNPGDCPGEAVIQGSEVISPAIVDKQGEAANSGNGEETLWAWVSEAILAKDIRMILV